MNTKKPDLNSIIAKSNELVPKLGKFDLQELRLVAYALAHLDSTKAENKTFTARVEDMAEVFCMDENRAYGVVQQVVASVNAKPLKVVQGDEARHIYWFSEFVYKSGSGTFTFTLTESIRPFLLELKERFSVYRLGDVHNFKSASTWKMYEHLNQWKYTGGWHVKIDDLRELLGVDGKYDRFNSFRENFIDPALLEINEKSNLSVDYVKEREGKNVVSLRFFIRTKEKVYVHETEHEKNMLLRLLLQAGIRYETSDKLLTKIIATGKEKHFLKKIPEIINRWNEAKGPIAIYMTGAIKSEIYDVNCDNRPYSDALRCRTEKNQMRIKCKVRIRGTAGNRHKCKMCLLYMPPDTYGI